MKNNELIKLIIFIFTLLFGILIILKSTSWDWGSNENMTIVGIILSILGILGILFELYYKKN